MQDSNDPETDLGSVSTMQRVSKLQGGKAVTQARMQGPHMACSDSNLHVMVAGCMPPDGRHLNMVIRNNLDGDWQDSM